MFYWEIKTTSNYSINMGAFYKCRCRCHGSNTWLFPAACYCRSWPLCTPLNENVVQFTSLHSAPSHPAGRGSAAVVNTWRDAVESDRLQMQTLRSEGVQVAPATVSTKFHSWSDSSSCPFVTWRISGQYLTKKYTQSKQNKHFTEPNTYFQRAA